MNALRKHLLPIALLAATAVHAQLVFIPDVDLRTALNEWVPGCVDAGGYLDPALPAVQAETMLPLNIRWSPADLTGLEALANLQWLIINSECFDGSDWWPCADNVINLSECPPSLQLLQLDRGTYIGLPDWPTTLDSLLLLEPEGYTSIPALPIGITYFYMTTPSGFTDMPTLPASLQSVTLGMRTGQQIPELPNGLLDLYIAGDFGITMPVLPPALATIYIDFLEGAIVTDAWPASLTSISLGSMVGLEQLPPTWPDGLQSIQLYALPQIGYIPSLPEGLQSMWLGEMPVTALPPLPNSLTSLTLDGLAQLTCLPLLPEGLTTLWIDTYVTPPQPTAINCVPNFPMGAEILLEGQPIAWDPQYLCTSLNSICPFLNPVAMGTVYLDDDADGVFDIGENTYPEAVIHVEPGGHMFGTQPNGVYTLPLPPDLYTITATCDAVNLLSIAPASHAADLSDPSAVDVGNDFGVVLEPIVQDLAIQLTIPQVKAGFIRLGMFHYVNQGSTPMAGTAKLILHPYLDFVDASEPPTSVTPSVVEWDFTDLQPGELRTIFFSFLTPSFVPVGLPVSNLARVEPVIGDVDQSENESVQIVPVVSSYDPNDKTVEPDTISPQAIAAGAELDYMIRFLNTGTAAAERIVITDTLSADLQWSSMRFVQSSHPCSWMLTGEGVLRFTFDPILLPDSTTDEPGSHGFVRFAMSPQQGLLLGQTVENVANIYFDFNAPVITEPAVFTIDATASLSDGTAPTLELHPNPVSDHLVVQCTWSGVMGVEILDARGRSVVRSMLAGARSVIDVSSLPAGIYQLRAMGATYAGTGRFVKQ